MASVKSPDSLVCDFFSFLYLGMCFILSVQVVAVVLEAGGFLAPIFVHFDEEFEEDFLAKEGFEVSPSVAAYFLEGGSGASDDDAFLGFAFDVDDRADADDGGFFFELLDLNFDAVGDFLVVVEENLLPDDFVDEEALGLVGQLVFVEERRTLGQNLDNALHEGVDAEAFLRRYLEDLGLRECLVPEGDEVLEGSLRSKVNLVDNQEDA